MISGTLQLLPTPCNKKIKSYDFYVHYQLSQNKINLSYQMGKTLYQLFQNQQAGPSFFKRKDHLWEKNCLEFFLKPDPKSESYLEFNFSVDGEWNAFHFDDYRLGKKEETALGLKSYEITKATSSDEMIISAQLTHDPSLKLNTPLLHGSAILYLDQKPHHFHNLPASQRPPDFHTFHHY